MDETLLIRHKAIQVMKEERKRERELVEAERKSRVHQHNNFLKLFTGKF